MISGIIHQGDFGRFLLIHLPECLYILFEIGLGWTVIFPSTMTFFSTVFVSDVVQISSGSLIILFSVAFIVSSFSALRKHELVAGPVGLGISIIIIIRLIV